MVEHWRQTNSITFWLLQSCGLTYRRSIIGSSKSRVFCKITGKVRRDTLPLDSAIGVKGISNADQCSQTSLPAQPFANNIRSATKLFTIYEASPCSPLTSANAPNGHQPSLLCWQASILASKVKWFFDLFAVSYINTT